MTYVWEILHSGKETTRREYDMSIPQSLMGNFKIIDRNELLIASHNGGSARYERYERSVGFQRMRTGFSSKKTFAVDFAVNKCADMMLLDMSILLGGGPVMKEKSFQSSQL